MFLTFGCTCPLRSRIIQQRRFIIIVKCFNLSIYLILQILDILCINIFYEISEFTVIRIFITFFPVRNYIIATISFLYTGHNIRGLAVKPKISHIIRWFRLRNKDLCFSINFIKDFIWWSSLGKFP